MQMCGLYLPNTPGATLMTRIPNGDSSFASGKVRPAMAAMEGIINDLCVDLYRQITHYYLLMYRIQQSSHPIQVWMIQ